MGEPFSVRVSVRGYEVDVQGHLNQAVYLQYAEHARWERLRSAGITQAGLAAEAIGPAVLETTIRYRRELREGDEVDVTCEWEWGERKIFHMRQSITRVDGVVAAELDVVAGILDLRARRLVPNPAERLRAIATRPELVGV